MFKHIQTSLNNSFGHRSTFKNRGTAVESLGRDVFCAPGGPGLDDSRTVMGGFSKSWGMPQACWMVYWCLFHGKSEHKIWMGDGRFPHDFGNLQIWTHHIRTISQTFWCLHKRKSFTTPEVKNALNAVFLVRWGLHSMLALRPCSPSGPGWAFHSSCLFAYHCWFIGWLCVDIRWANLGARA